VTGATRDPAPTRSALLELRHEEQAAREGFELLDQKRMLLAATTLRWLDRHVELDRRRRDAVEEAMRCLAEALAFHGLRDLARRPAGTPAVQVEIRRGTALGVAVVEAEARDQERRGTPEAASTPELRRCRAAFAELVAALVDVAAAEGNLHRLTAEYQRTERRARALEDVILPEIASAVGRMSERIEADELEEAVRVRLRRLSWPR
jgi:V/A-type H+-transporting ATPase subunit D